MTDIKNSNNKIIGFTEITNDQIMIHNNKKPELCISDKEIIEAIKNKDRSDIIIKKLYDEYYLNIGEIASLYDVCYSNINKQTRQIAFQTSPKAGRRNRSFGKQQSDETKKKISDNIKDGYNTGRIKKSSYERTPEIKEKISNSLKEYFKENPQNPLPHIENWKNGVYDKVDFHIGIGGAFYSIKNLKKLRFRSLLELCYLLKIEEDDDIKKYSYEPIKILCDNGHIYIPDVLVNDYQLIELKSLKWVNSIKGQKEKVQYKKEQAEKYCSNHNLVYKIIYDEEIDFKSSKFKRHLKNNPQIIDKYNIIFNQPERMVIK